MSRRSLCSSEDMFNSSNDDVRKNHCDALSAMVYIAHLLPLACNSGDILEMIFDPLHDERNYNFHQWWLLNGWNDDIIQPARNAVLEYYKVRNGTAIFYL